MKSKSIPNSLVSVVVTCYGYARYLRTAVDSALRQTVRHIEVIVINDGSPDGTDEVMRAYAGDPRVKYMKQAHGGQAKAKNLGIRHSRGEFVAFLDADDSWIPEKLAKQLPLFQNVKVGVVYSRMQRMDESGHPIAPPKVNHPYFVPRRGRVTDPLFLENFLPFSSTVVRRKVLDQWGIFDETLQMGIDWDLWLRLSIHREFDFVNQPLMYYRVGHSGQMSKSAVGRKVGSDKIMKKFVVDNPGLLPDSVVRQAWVYTYCTRGRQFRPINLLQSTRFYLKALRLEIWHWFAWRGLIKNFLLMLVSPTSLWKSRVIQQESRI